MNAAQEMTITEAAARYGIKRRTLGNAVDSGRVEARQSGRIWMITQKAMVTAIISGRVKPDNATVDRMVEEYLNAPE